MATATQATDGTSTLPVTPPPKKPGVIVRAVRSVYQYVEGGIRKRIVIQRIRVRSFWAQRQALKEVSQSHRAEIARVLKGPAHPKTAAVTSRTIEGTVIEPPAPVRKRKTVAKPAKPRASRKAVVKAGGPQIDLVPVAVEVTEPTKRKRSRPRAQKQGAGLPVAQECTVGVVIYAGYVTLEATGPNGLLLAPLEHPEAYELSDQLRYVADLVEFEKKIYDT